ncbi:MAG: 8-amino-7-oxononanoate synthase [Proteobacteria bacterium]|nr:8-amino-7-oxononanoate synthase [Pseudomonadota bacterium]MBU1709752.1 8-amino-7-oxononanoate synthase [Pseudomonadota bacterium]
MDDYVSQWLEEQKAAGTLRKLVPHERIRGGRIKLVSGAEAAGPLWDFSSNDYLALTEHPEVIKKSREFLEQYGAGAGAARLMSGDNNLNHLLEESIAKLKGKESALVFGSGYMANIGVLPALAGRGDVIFTDRLNHASIYDGCKLSGAQMQRFQHNDVNHLEELLRDKRGKGRALIVVESIYSMDGDRCPLRDLVAIKNKYSCQLMVDEAHATGVFGSNGGGVIQEEGVVDQVDIAMGTFGKALGSYGAYIAASHDMVQFLINKARSFVYSTALPPAVIGASLAAVKVVEKGEALRRELFAKVGVFKDALRENGIGGDFGPSQIVPVLIGDVAKAVNAALSLRRQGVFATAVRPPTVPKGTSRLRFSVTRHLPDEVLKETAHLLGRIL